MNQNILFSILIFAPLLGFLFNGFRYKNQDYKLAGAVATGAVGLSFVASVLLVAKLMGMDEAQRQISFHLFEWIHVGDFKANAAFLVDPISAIMILVITGVGTLIHLFSIGYMSHDDRPSKYFAFLNFFLFNMLLLVLGDNLLVMFVGWEGVGLCSYLLIGFWFKDSEKAAAGMKAFITNRIGDAGFLLGMFFLFMNFGTIEFAALTARMPEVAETLWSSPIHLACLFLFIGAMGKSAQIPLYVWLPDAMAGPTPVSALIHAATMVTAGVYMIVRLNGVFIMAPNVMMFIAIIGGLTAVLAATIGMTQWDIKKVLAYSTVSQLGYMFLGVGVGAFMPAMFHLMTHAFFKALMFLGSGSVIHAMGDEQDIRKMGGLSKLMPITSITFTLGWLAIIGIPPFAGFFSKDEILWQSLTSTHGHYLLWGLGVIGAILTAFYMTRLMCLVFWGDSRVPKDTHPHESPISMTIPLIVLGFLSVVGGWIGIPHVISSVLPGHLPNILQLWLKSSIVQLPVQHFPVAIEWAVMGVSVGLAGMSALIAYNFYISKKERPAKFVSKCNGMYQLIYNKYWVDEIYFDKLINPLIRISRGLWEYVDVYFIDNITHYLSDYVQSASEGFRKLHNGKMQQYGLYLFLGLVILLSYSFMGL
jgi:NADH-quinone oxidoreductase subunit L